MRLLVRTGGVSCFRGCSSIFQDALGHSDGNKSIPVFRVFQEYLRLIRLPLSKRDMFEKVAFSKQSLCKKRKRKKFYFSSFSFFFKPLLRKENSSQTPTACFEVSFRRRLCAAISFHPTPGARILTSFSFISLKNHFSKNFFRKAKKIFVSSFSSFHLADFSFFTVFRR